MSRKHFFTEMVSICALSFCFAVEGAAFAQYSNGAEFDLRRTMEYSMKNNGDLAALRAEKGLGEAGKIRAGLSPNPVLELEGAAGSDDESRFSIGISREFVTQGKREKRLHVAGREMDVFARRIDNAERLLTRELKTTFYGLLLAERRLALADRSLELNRQFLNIAGDRFDLGDIPELEVNLARVEFARSEGKRVDAENGIAEARARLLGLMGFAPGRLDQLEQEIRFIGSLEAAQFSKTLDELKVMALSHRPDLKALEAERGAGDAEIALAVAERTPNITASLSVQREASSIEVGGDDIRDRDTLVGIKLSIPLPLFDWNQAGLMEARARKESTEHRYRFLRKSVEREVEAAFARLTTAEKTLSIYAKDIIPQLEENMQLVQEAYRLGEVGVLAVIEEQKKFFEVNDGYLTAGYNRMAAMSELEAAVGADLSLEIAGGEK